MRDKPLVLTQEEITAAYTLPHKRARYGDFAIDLTDLLRHRCLYSPCNCHVSCAFEALRWMYGLAERWQKRKGRVHPICHALAHDRSVIPNPHFHVTEFGANWADVRHGLPGIFDVLLLAAETGEVAAWCARHRLFAYQRHVIPAPATASMRNAYRWAGFAESCDLRRALERLLTFSGDFKFSPNECHPKARWAREVKLRLDTYRGPRWQVRAYYSYHGDPCSSWHVLVAEQKPREAFHFFIGRALTQLHNMCGFRRVL